MAIDIHSIPIMSAGVNRLFSQWKIMFTDRRNSLHIDGPEAVECMESRERLSIGFPEVVVNMQQTLEICKARISSKWIWMKVEC